jgi:hypothetical protein
VFFVEFVCNEDDKNALTTWQNTKNHDKKNIEIFHCDRLLRGEREIPLRQKLLWHKKWSKMKFVTLFRRE